MKASTVAVGAAALYAGVGVAVSYLRFGITNCPPYSAFVGGTKTENEYVTRDAGDGSLIVGPATRQVTYYCQHMGLLDILMWPLYLGRALVGSASDNPKRLT